MKSFSFILLLALPLVASCQTKPKTNQTPAAMTTENMPVSNNSDHKNNPYYSRTETKKLTVSDAEWKKILPPNVYHVAREKGTERAFTGQFWNTETLGNYYCAVCGNLLFRSDQKFSSSCGWPSFFEAKRPDAVRYERDSSYGMERIEVLCNRCDSHLGHIFDDGPKPTGKRFCMNSIVLDFEPDNALQSK